MTDRERKLRGDPMHALRLEELLERERGRLEDWLDALDCADLVTRMASDLHDGFVLDLPTSFASYPGF